jgi:hypothetical protein
MDMSGHVCPNGDSSLSARVAYAGLSVTFSTLGW